LGKPTDKQKKQTWYYGQKGKSTNLQHSPVIKEGVLGWNHRRGIGFQFLGKFQWIYPAQFFTHGGAPFDELHRFVGQHPPKSKHYWQKKCLHQLEVTGGFDDCCLLPEFPGAIIGSI